MHPAWREFRDELSATVTRIIAYLGVLAVIAVTFMLIIMPPDSDSDESTGEPAFRSDWTTVGRPIRAFSLSTPEFAQPNSDYAIQRHVSGGGRRDIMNWGGGSSEGPAKRRPATVTFWKGRRYLRAPSPWRTISPLESRWATI